MNEVFSKHYAALQNDWLEARTPLGCALVVFVIPDSRLANPSFTHRHCRGGCSTTWQSFKMFSGLSWSFHNVAGVRNLLNGYKGCWERMGKAEAIALCGRCRTSCTGYRFPGAKSVENWLQSLTEVRKTQWQGNTRTVTLWARPNSL